MRAIAAAMVAVLGYVSTAATLGDVLRVRDVERAHDLAPSDGRITALLAQKLSGPEATTAGRARASALAKRALRQDASAVVAASTLGLNAQVAGDAKLARRFFAYANRLSRRDFATQLWSIEDAVARGDVDGALRHYDIALRTSRTTSDLLFPILGAAIAQAEIRSALVRTLTKRPTWGAAFIQYAATEGSDPRSSGALLAKLEQSGVMVPTESEVALIGRLVAAGFIDEAWMLYAVGHPRADRRVSRDARFTADPAQASAFDWKPVHDTGISASVQRGADGGVVDLAVPTSVSGPMLEQLQFLPPGDYGLIGHSIGVDQPERSAPYWELVCTDGRQLGRVDVPSSDRGGGRFAGRFRVPADCRAQTLRLSARPTDAVAGLTGQIDHVLLSPVGR